jgi:hypothetical protein
VDRPHLQMAVPGAPGVCRRALRRARELGRGAARARGGQFRLTPGYFGLAVAVFGTTVSPYMFFWQTAQRVEQLRDEDLKGSKAPSLSDRSASGPSGGSVAAASMCSPAWCSAC